MIYRRCYCVVDIHDSSHLRTITIENDCSIGLSCQDYDEKQKNGK